MSTYTGTDHADTPPLNTKDDLLLGLGGDDFLISEYNGAVALSGGEGNDYLALQATPLGHAIMWGDEGNDTLHGAFNDDNLYGGEGNDVIMGSGGYDYVVGGCGNDVMTGDEGRDHLHGEDGVDRIEGGADNDVIYGEGGNDTNATMFVVGWDKKVVTGGLYGGAGDDSIFGGDGNDFIDGGTGVDKMDGGAGDDVMVVDNALDKVFEAAGAGHDTVMASVSYALKAGQSVEVLETTSSGGSAGIALIGNEFGQSIIGNAGNNTLDGRDGADTLTGGAGYDAFNFYGMLGPKMGVDHITDFSTPWDTIQLDDGSFKHLSLGALKASDFKDITNAAEDADDHILYNHEKGALYYDADGAGGAKPVAFAILDNHAALTYHDFLIV